MKITISITELIVTWICASIGIVLNNYLRGWEYMSLHEMAAAIYFMFMYMSVLIISGMLEKCFGNIKSQKKDDCQSKETEIIGLLDLVSMPEHMMPGCPTDYPAVKIYRTYQLPKLDSEDLYATYERTMGVHPGAALEKGDMVRRKDLVNCPQK